MNGRNYLDTAVYECNRGYVLSGVSVRTCGLNGVWDGDAPTCTRKYIIILLSSNTFKQSLNFKLPSLRDISSLKEFEHMFEFQTSKFEGHFRYASTHVCRQVDQFKQVQISSLNSPFNFTHLLLRSVLW